MEEPLITFETAKLAKKIGFPQILKDWSYEYTEDGQSYPDLSIPFHKSEMERFKAPTQSLLQKWLRDEHNLNVEVNHGGYNKEDRHYSFRCIIKKITKRTNKMMHDCMSEIDGDWYIFRTYEDALEIGLKEGLNLIK